MLKEGAGKLADGFISVGGASTPQLASPKMKEFVARYTKMFGIFDTEKKGHLTDKEMQQVML